MRAKSKCLFVISLMGLTISGCRVSKFSENRSLLKQYAFCQCLDFAYRDTCLFRSKDISRPMYRDIAMYNLDVYEVIDSLSKVNASNIQPSIIGDHEGKRAIVKGCFEFYHGKTLDSMVRSFDKKITKWH